LSGPSEFNSTDSSTDTSGHKEKSAFTDKNENGCPDQVESFHVENEQDENVTIHVTVSRDEDSLVSEETFEMPPNSVQSASEPVFEKTDAQYYIEATYDGVTKREVIEGVSCENRRDRFISVEVSQLGTLEIQVQTGDYQPSN
jgi:hypothetical protein